MQHRKAHKTGEILSVLEHRIKVELSLHINPLTDTKMETVRVRVRERERHREGPPNIYGVVYYRLWPAPMPYGNWPHVLLPAGQFTNVWRLIRCGAAAMRRVRRQLRMLIVSLARSLVTRVRLDTTPTAAINSWVVIRRRASRREPSESRRIPGVRCPRTLDLTTVP